jgi:hypothetical protein
VANLAKALKIQWIEEEFFVAAMGCDVINNRGRASSVEL